jgi:hypothetical protein
LNAAGHGTGSLSARMLFKTSMLQKGYFLEDRIVQKSAGSRIDALLIRLTDHPGRV